MLTWSAVVGTAVLLLIAALYVPVWGHVVTGQVTTKYCSTCPGPTYYSGLSTPFNLPDDTKVSFEWNDSSGGEVAVMVGLGGASAYGGGAWTGRRMNTTFSTGGFSGPFQVFVVDLNDSEGAQVVSYSLAFVTPIL